MAEAMNLAGVSALGARLRWRVQYGWAGLRGIDRALVVTAVSLLVLFWVLNRQLDQEGSTLQQQEAAVIRFKSQKLPLVVDHQAELLTRFQEFLPGSSTQKAFWADVHQRAEANGVVVSRVSLASASCEFNVCASHNMGLLLTGSRDVAEHFMLELLKEYPSLVLERMTIHIDPTNEALVSLELELDYLTKAI